MEKTKSDWIDFYLAGGDIPNAIRILKTHIRLYPKDIDSQLSLAYLEMLFGDYDFGMELKLNVLNVQRIFKYKTQLSRRDSLKLTPVFYCELRKMPLNGLLPVSLIVTDGAYHKSCWLEGLIRDSELEIQYLENVSNINSLTIANPVVNVSPLIENIEYLTNLTLFFDKQNVNVFNHPRNILKLLSYRNSNYSHNIENIFSINDFLYEEKCDLFYRYYVCMIDGSPYIYQVAVSSNFVPDYSSALMHEDFGKRELEKKELESFSSKIKKFKSSLDMIHEILELDFYVIELTFLPEYKGIYIFDINISSFILCEINKEFEYKKKYYEEIINAFNLRLLRLNW